MRERQVEREERDKRERERQTGLRGALCVEQDVGLSAAHLLHAAHVHLRVITVNPETCNTNKAMKRTIQNSTVLRLHP